MSYRLFLLTLANLNVSEAQRNFCLNNKINEELSFDEAEKIAKQAGLESFTLSAWKHAFEMIQLHSLQQIHVIPLGMDAYPKTLQSIQNPPRILLAKGNLDLLKKSSVSIVGSRSASDYGLKVAERIAAHFSKENYVIVSGLAAGIDFAAHSSCLAHKGSTIAVLAHGLHRFYPTENASLGQSILDKGGLLISEYPLGIEPQKHFFILRNRIQVGLSLFSIIIEAKKKSGTMSHADFCFKAKHPLYVVLPQKHISASNFEGNLWLYEERGAIPLRSSLDYPKTF